MPLHTSAALFDFNTLIKGSQQEILFYDDPNLLADQETTNLLADTSSAVGKIGFGVKVSPENRASPTPLFDDGLSPLTCEEYVKIRLIPMMREY